MVQNLKTTIQIGGGITSGLLNTFNPLRKRLQDTEKGLARMTRASRNFDRAMKATTDPARYNRLLRRNSEILEKIRAQRRETARLTRASNQYGESLKRIGPALGIVTGGIVGIRQAFSGVLQDFAEFKEVQAETGIEAARLASVSFRTRPLVPGLRPERIGDFVAQAAREAELRLQEAAIGRVGLKQYIVLPTLLQKTQRGTMEPIQQLATVLRHIQTMPEHRRASALEEVVGGTEGEILTGLFRRKRIDRFIEALDNSTDSVYQAGQAMDRFWSVLIQVQQSFLLLGYTLVNFVVPVLEPVAAIALKLATSFQQLLRNTGVVGEALGTYLVSAAFIAAGALAILAIKAIFPVIVSFALLTRSAVAASLAMFGITIPISALLPLFLGLAAVLSGIVAVLSTQGLLRLPETEGPTQGFNQTINITGTNAQEIGAEVARQTAYGVPGRF